MAVRFIKLKDAIVLRAIERGDSDIAIHLIDKKGTKLYCVAKNAKKSVKRYGSSLDVLVIFDGVMRISERGAYLEEIWNAKAIRFHDYRASLCALYAVDLIDIVFRERQRDIQLRRLLLKFIEYLHKHTPDRLTLIIFELVTGSICGFWSRKAICSNCGKKAELFDTRNSEFVCRYCKRDDSFYRPLSNTIQKYIGRGGFKEALENPSNLSETDKQLLIDIAGCVLRNMLGYIPARRSFILELVK